MEIGLHREIDDDKDDREKGAAEPGKIAVQEIHRLGTSFGSQPVTLIGEINELRRQQRNEARDTEPDHGHKNAYADQHADKHGFSLPPVRRATGVEPLG